MALAALSFPLSMFLVYSAARWSAMPARIVDHWSLSNEPDGSSPRAVIAAVLGGLCVLFTVGVVAAAFSRDREAARRGAAIVTLFSGGSTGLWIALSESSIASGGVLNATFVGARWLYLVTGTVWAIVPFFVLPKSGIPNTREEKNAPG